MKSSILLAGALLLPATGTPAQVNQDTPLSAGSSQQQPASLLIFPILDSDGATETLITVTNVNADRTLVPGYGTARGAVRALFVYVLPGPGGCTLFDTQVELSPGDTFTVTARDHARATGTLQGWLYVLAADVFTGQPIDFDDELPTTRGFSGLVGEEIVVHGGPQAYLYALPALSFKALSRGAQPRRNLQGYLLTDAPENGGNEDGEADLNGLEYEKFPRVLSAPLFLEQATPSFQDQLVLFTPITWFDSRIDLGSVWFNNNEGPRSRTFSFSCWTRTQIRNITAAVTNLGGTPAEPATGWFWIDPATVTWNRRVDADPPVHGAFLHSLAAGSNAFWAANLLHQEGEVDPVPGIFGDRGNGLPH